MMQFKEVAVNINRNTLSMTLDRPSSMDDAMEIVMHVVDHMATEETSPHLRIVMTHGAECPCRETKAFESCDCETVRVDVTPMTEAEAEITTMTGDYDIVMDMEGGEDGPTIPMLRDNGTIH